MLFLCGEMKIDFENLNCLKNFLTFSFIFECFMFHVSLQIFAKFRTEKFSKQKGIQSSLAIIQTISQILHPLFFFGKSKKEKPFHPPKKKGCFLVGEDFSFSYFFFNISFQKKREKEQSQNYLNSSQVFFPSKIYQKTENIPPPFLYYPFLSLSLSLSLSLLLLSLFPPSHFSFSSGNSSINCWRTSVRVWPKRFSPLHSDRYFARGSSA